MKKRVDVGQKVYIIDRRHRYRAKGPQLEEAVITKVGRKYLYVSMSDWDTERFRLEDLRHDNGGYVSQINLYLSRQEYIDECQYNHLKDKIRRLFTGYDSGTSIDLDQLKQIAAILGIDEVEI